MNNKQSRIMYLLSQIEEILSPKNFLHNPYFISNLIQFCFIPLSKISCLSRIRKLNATDEEIIEACRISIFLDVFEHPAGVFFIATHFRTNPLVLVIRNVKNTATEKEVSEFLYRLNGRNSFNVYRIKCPYPQNFQAHMAAQMSLAVMAKNTNSAPQMSNISTNNNNSLMMNIFESETDDYAVNFESLDECLMVWRALLYVKMNGHTLDIEAYSPEYVIRQPLPLPPVAIANPVPVQMNHSHYYLNGGNYLPQINIPTVSTSVTRKVNYLQVSAPVSPVKQVLPRLDIQKNTKPPNGIKLMSNDMNRPIFASHSK